MHNQDSIRKIEDFFDPVVLATKLNGKSFNPKNEGVDTETEYGKWVFAQQVVKPNVGSIDFGKGEDAFTAAAGIQNQPVALVDARGFLATELNVAPIIRPQPGVMTKADHLYWKTHNQTAENGKYVEGAENMVTVIFDDNPCFSWNGPTTPIALAAHSATHPAERPYALDHLPLARPTADPIGTAMTRLFTRAPVAEVLP